MCVELGRADKLFDKFWIAGKVCVFSVKGWTGWLGLSYLIISKFLICSRIYLNFLLLYLFLLDHTSLQMLLKPQPV